jgi:two-component system CheB/CheR fusion protein
VLQPEACSDFLDDTSPDTGATFVPVYRVDPEHKSLMADLLAKLMVMPEVLAEDQKSVELDHVYVIPRNKYLKIKKGVLAFVKSDRSSRDADAD